VTAMRRAEFGCEMLRYPGRRSGSGPGWIQSLMPSVADLPARREISSELLRALFRRDAATLPPAEAPLTRREDEVLQLISTGFTNKEIARKLTLSVATVNHRVHKILDKLQVTRRSHAMRQVRDNPWLAAWAPQETERPARRSSGVT
jgi:DNA-binding CsgD family transcriptional regulator